MSSEISKSWFVVFNNPQQHGYTGTPKEILEQLKQEWIGDSSTRSGIWTYCISVEGLHHVHMVLEDKTAMRFSKIKKSYAKGAHFEATKGLKNQVEAYINKKPPFAEKGEQVKETVEHGKIIGASPTLSKHSDALAIAEELLNDGKSLKEILSSSIYLRKHESTIRREYFARKADAIPPKREVKVIWHVGQAGTGKSYTYAELCKEFGEEHVYMMNDFKSGGLDFYLGEEILFMDEFKGNMEYQQLLNITDGYKIQIHCRYSNAYALWHTVHITSVYPPETAYSFMVNESDRGVDSVAQLLRRISKVIYHYKEDNKFKTFELSGKEYTNYDDLLRLSGTAPNKFVKIPPNEFIPFPQYKQGKINF